MLAASSLAIFVVPVLFAMITKIAYRNKPKLAANAEGVSH